MSILNSNIRLSETHTRIRPPAVAGTFYPDNPSELQQLVRSYLDDTVVNIPAPKAIIAPHAGFIYSGPIAAKAYASIKPVKHKIKHVILLGPAHHAYLEGLALPSDSVFASPLGKINIDRELTKLILRLPQVSIMDSAHRQEHSLEVHLPFLQTVLEDFTLVPLVVGNASVEEVTQVLRALWGGEETLIVISSDLSHYHDYQNAQHIDTETSEAIRQLQFEKIDSKQACGCIPMRGLLNIAKQNGMDVQILDVRNSGDTAGSHDRVVGYGAYSIHNGQSLSTQHQKQLLTIARDSIELGLSSGKSLKPDADKFDLIMKEKRATFVTLKINSQLRGCIGTTQAVSPLTISVADNAFSAAFRDPRFQALTESEYQNIELSISLLSLPTKIEFSSEQTLLVLLRPQIDGLIIQKAGKKATFLPEVWLSLPEPSDFLKQLKQKAGIRPADSPDKAWRYQAEHIS